MTLEKTSAQTRPHPFRALLILLAGLVALAVPVQLHFVAHLDSDTFSDLYSPWFGSRAALHHSDPYSPAITAQIQHDMYGHPLAPDDPHDPEAFVYPPWIVFLLAPFTLLPWPTVESALRVPHAARYPRHHRRVDAPLPSCIRPPLRNRRLCADSRQLACRLGLLPAPAFPLRRSRHGLFRPALQPKARHLRRHPARTRDRKTSAGPASRSLAHRDRTPSTPLAIRCVFLRHARGPHRRLRTALPGSIPHWIYAAIAYTHAAGKVSLLTHLFGPRLGLLADIALIAALGIRLWQLRSAAPGSSAFVSAAALVLAVTTCLIPGNPWLLFNNLLLIPAVLLLSTTSAPTQISRLFQTLAGIALFLVVLITPLCAAIGLFTSYRFNLVMPPFVLGYLLPLPVAAAMFFLPPGAEPQS